MKHAILTVACLCFLMSLQAEVSKAANLVARKLSSASDTLNTKSTNFGTKGSIGATAPLPTQVSPAVLNELNLERDFESERIESERQTLEEMENYRSEILIRLVKAEYSRLINNTSPGLTDNSRDGILKLAKYRTLRDLLNEQISRPMGPAVPGTGNTNLPVNNPIELDNLVQQLDKKIREEEQRAEMAARHRIEMEQRIELENQKQKK